MKSSVLVLLYLLTAIPVHAQTCEDLLRQDLPKIEQLTVSAVQFPIRGNTPEKTFMADMEAYVRRGAAKGAQLIVFPELLILDVLKSTDLEAQGRELETLATDFTPRFFQKIKDLSRKYKVSVLGGSSPRKVGEATRNTTLLAFPNGRTVLQDKLFMTPDEKVWGWKGGDTLRVFDTPWGRTTILICYDSQFPCLSNALAEHAPEVILIPSMTSAHGKERVRWASQARAVEHHAYVITTGTVNPRGQAGPFSAQAVALTPQDEGWPGVLKEAPKDRPSAMTVTLDLPKLRKSRKEAGVYSAREQTDLRDSIIRVGD